MFMANCKSQPRSRKTPSGGRRMAKRTLQISLAVNGILRFYNNRKTFVEPKEEANKNSKE